MNLKMQNACFDNQINSLLYFSCFTSSKGIILLSVGQKRRITPLGGIVEKINY